MQTEQTPRESLCLVVPAFNEAERASEAIDELIDFIEGQALGSELIVVDDGSTDETADVVRARIKVQRSTRSRVVERPHAGKGAALRSGLLQSNSETAAFCDIDLATPLHEVERIAGLAGKYGCLVIGSRAVATSDLRERESRRRELAGRLYNAVVRHALTPGIADTQCGAKAAPTSLWHQVLGHSEVDGFAWDVEVIALAFRLGSEVREVGVEWRHDGRTTVKVLRDGMSMLAVIPSMFRSVHRVRPVLVPVADGGVIDLTDVIDLTTTEATATCETAFGA